MGIFFIGFGVTTYHGVHSLLNLGEYQNPDLTIPIVVLTFAFIIEGYVLFVAYQAIKEKKGKHSILNYIKKGDDPTTVAVLLEDGVAVLGVVIALIGIWLSRVLQTNMPDAITSIIIGFLLGFLAFVLIRSNARLLICLLYTSPSPRDS